MTRVAEKSRLRQALSKWADSSDQHQRDLRESYRITEGETLAIADAPER